MFDRWLFWPFATAFVGAWLIVAILFLAFWIWMIVDCAKRKFRSDAEKALWLVVIVLGSWIGALVYFVVIKQINTQGIFRK